MESLLNGYRRFRQDVYPQQSEVFQRLATGQSPHTLFITCADSRVMPELIFSAQPGELFVYRNIGNVVPTYSQQGGVVAAIEYAVAVLGVKNIVICGHSDCGAMKAALNPVGLEEKVPTVAKWLKHTDAARHVAAVRSHGHPEGELACMTEENVVLQLDHLRTQPVVAARLASGSLRIHGWVYDIAHGEIRAFDTEQGKFVPLLREDGRTPEATPRPRLAEALLAEAS